MEKKIIIGSDHAGFQLKEILIEELKERSFEIIDVGCFNTNSVHYPQIGQEVASRVNSGEFTKGILICGTGIGMSITANRFKNVRAALCHDLLSAKYSREHNDANILVLGERLLGVTTAKEILQIWLNAEFQGGRHQERLKMIDQ